MIVPANKTRLALMQLRRQTKGSPEREGRKGNPAVAYMHLAPSFGGLVPATRRSWEAPAWKGCNNHGAVTWGRDTDQRRRSEEDEESEESEESDAYNHFLGCL